MFKAVVFDLYETLVTQTGTVVPRGGALGNRSDSIRPPIAANGSSCARRSCAAS